MKNVSANLSAKAEAGHAAAALVEDGMLVGLGTGSTAAFAITEIGRRVQAGEIQIRCVATSFQARILALDAGLLLLDPGDVKQLDISIDGADEIDSALNLIKGGGAAHTLEKIIHSMSRRFIVVADESKEVAQLGQTFAVPVEVLSAARSYVGVALQEMGASELNLRMARSKDGPVVTDNGNLVLDARFKIEYPEHLEMEINNIAGVVENGIFARARPHAGDCIIGSENGVKYL